MKVAPYSVSSQEPETSGRMETLLRQPLQAGGVEGQVDAGGGVHIALAVSGVRGAQHQVAFRLEGEGLHHLMLVVGDPEGVNGVPLQRHQRGKQPVGAPAGELIGDIRRNV